MRYFSHFADAVLVLLLVSAVGGRAQDRGVSLGSLRRADPNAVEIPGVVAIYGKPDVGISGGGGGSSKLQRLNKENRWLLGTGRSVSIMTPGTIPGQMETREVIEAGFDWSVSPDGSHIFAARTPSAENGIPGREIYECFDLSTGNSLWVFDTSQDIYDTSFTPDGNQVAILHGGQVNSMEVPSIVSWYDTVTGKRTKSVALPGLMKRKIDGTSDLLAFTKDGLYVTRHSEKDGRCFFVANGAEAARPFDPGEFSNEEILEVRSGGPDRDFVAIYNRDKVNLYREKEGKLVFSGEIETPVQVEGSYENNVRFSPDGATVLISSPRRTRVYETASPGASPKTVPTYSGMGEFSSDGKGFVFFDAGGGRLYRTSDWIKVEPPLANDHPVHCCPIEQAGFSTNGKLILSNDERQLLLWSEDGRLLAELSSPKEKEDIMRVKMQSAVFLPDGIKIYAADGWDFLEWDLNEVAARVKRKPINTPRIVGKVILDNASGKRPKPVTMNIGLDSTGKNVITASGPVVRYWPVGSDAVPAPLKVPQDDIQMTPRLLHKPEGESGILLNSAGSIFMLNTDGKTAAIDLRFGAAGLDPSDGKFFSLSEKSSRLELAKCSATGERDSGDSMQLPDEWKMSFRRITVSPKGSLLAIPRNSNGKSYLSLIDWKQKKIGYDHPLPWAITSSEFSPDGSKLIVGSHNRAVYVFDTKKMLDFAK